MENNKALEKSYQIFQPFSLKYRVDFKRFLFSLKLLSSFGSVKNKKILDIGSGIGIMVGALKNLGADALGVDKFVFSIDDFGKLKTIWRENGIKITESNVVENKLPFDDETFDIIICDATIEHLPESPKNLFIEVRRVLKKEGLFLVTTPNLANLLRRIRFLLGRSPNWDIRDFFDSGPNFTGHRREFTLGELCAMLDWSSFRILKKETRNIFLDPKRFFVPSKIPGQICGLLSAPFLRAREMIYVLSSKN